MLVGTRAPACFAAIDSARNALEHEDFTDLSTEARGSVAQQLLAVVTQIATAPNPALANRESIFNAAHEMAKYDVLNLDVGRVHENPWLRGVDGVTGELRDRIGELVKLDSDLKEMMWEASVDLGSEEDLHGACRAGYLFSWMALNRLLKKFPFPE